MFSRCVRSVLIKRQAFNAAKQLFSTLSFDANNTVILKSSNQKHFTKAPARSFSVSYYLKNAAQNDCKCAKDAKRRIEAKGDLKNGRVSEKIKKQGITHFFHYRSNTLDDDVMRNMIYDGHDVIVQTGTGSEKIKSYAIPLVEKLLSESLSTTKHVKMVVVTPTDELSDLVAGIIRSCTCELSVVSMNGGTSISDRVRGSGVDILVGTPEGIKHTILSVNGLNIKEASHVVFHEIDTMINMGFASDIDWVFERRYRTYKKDGNPQTLFFSTTLPSWLRNTAQKLFSHEIRMIDLDVKKNSTSESIEDFNFEKNVFEKDMKDLRKFLKNVPESNKLKFDKLAKELMKNSDPSNILATALAVAAGYEQKSLIDHRPGFVTLKITSGKKVYDRDWAADLLPAALENKARNIRICHGMKSFVLDVPMLLGRKYMESKKNAYASNISVTEVLPLLQY